MTIQEQLNNVWVEKYRPKKLEDMVLSESLRTFVEECKRKKEIPNILFVGNAGTGKTSLAKIIVNDVLDSQYLYINASERNGIDEVRTSILSFAQTKSLDSKLKVIILDECLEENTLVWVFREKEQLIPIKDLNPDTDLVKSYSFKHSRIEWKPFKLFYKDEQEVYDVYLSNNEVVTCTLDHKWYVLYNGKQVKMKLKNIIKNNITEIISPSIID